MGESQKMGEARWDERVARVHASLHAACNRWKEQNMRSIQQTQDEGWGGKSTVWRWQVVYGTAQILSCRYTTPNSYTCTCIKFLVIPVHVHNTPVPIDIHATTSSKKGRTCTKRVQVLISKQQPTICESQTQHDQTAPCIEQHPHTHSNKMQGCRNSCNCRRGQLRYM